MHIEKVLLVDDDPSIRRIAALALSRVGKWHVLAAASGVEALELLPDYRPDVVLMDVMMPGLDGPTTFKMITADSQGFQPPIIFMTAKVHRQEVQSYYQMGAAGVITKPFDPMTLPTEIRNILKVRDASLCIA